MNDFRDAFQEFNKEIIDDLGDFVEYRNNNSHKFKIIKGVFNRTFQELFDGENVVNDRRTTLEVLYEDVPMPETGDEVKVNNCRWRVHSVQDTGRGYSELELRKC